MNLINAWKDELPLNWKVLPLKALASYMVSSVDKIIKEEELPVELCNYTDVYKNDFITIGMDFMKGSATAEEILKYKLEVGDVLITKDSESWDDIAIPALVKETKDKLICGYHLAIIRPDRTKIEPSYLFYCLQSKEIRIQLELASTGVTRYGLPKDEIGRALLPIPDIHLQQRICSFIDLQLEEIDKLVASKKELLDILVEKKQALISETVTKGICSNSEQKKSQLKSLEEAPMYWKKIPIKYLGKIFYGISQPPTYRVDGTALIRATNVYRGIIKKNGLVFVDENEIQAEKKFKLKTGDIIVVRSGAYTGDSAIITSEWENSIAGFDMIIRPDSNKVNANFLSIVLLSSYVLEGQILPLRIRAAQPHLNAEELGSVTILLPSIQEQLEIVDYLAIELSKITEMTNAALESIELLNERKSSLLTSAVTGKLSIPI